MSAASQWRPRPDPALTDPDRAGLRPHRHEPGHLWGWVFLQHQVWVDYWGNEHEVELMAGRVEKAGPHWIDQETAARIFATLDRERVQRARLAHQVRVLKNNRQRDARKTAELRAGLERAMGLVDLPEGHIFDSAEEFLAFVNAIPVRMEIPAPLGQLREFVEDRKHQGQTMFTLDDLGEYFFGTGAA